MVDRYPLSGADLENKAGGAIVVEKYIPRFARAEITKPRPLSGPHPPISGHINITQQQRD